MTTAASLCEEFGIRIIPANAMPGIGETRSPCTIERIIAKHGASHARMVVGTLAETANNKARLDEMVLWTVSDMVRAAEKVFPSVMENDVEQWYSFFDSLPLGQLQYWCQDLDGLMPKRYALGGMIFERMVRRFGSMASQPDLLDDRGKLNVRTRN